MFLWLTHGFCCNLFTERLSWGSVPLGGALLEGVDDLSIVAEFTDEAFLSTQTAAENVRAGKLDHLGQEGSQFSVNHLEGEGRWDRVRDKEEEQKKEHGHQQYRR